MTEQVHACPLCGAEASSEGELCAHLDHDHLGPVQPGRFTSYRPPTATARGMVTVPLDPGRPLSARPLDVAAALARQARYALELVSVVPPPRRVVAAAFLRAAARRVEAIGVTGERWELLDDGDVADRLVDHVADHRPDLVCVSTNPERDAGGLLGRVTGELLRRSPVPVVLVGPAVAAPARLIERIVVCLDGSPHAERALVAAARLSCRLGADLELVRVLGPKATGGRAYLRRMASRATGCTPSYDTIHERDPGRAIVDLVTAHAPGGILLAMGALGVSAASGAAGSTAAGTITRSVLLDAPCPVMVVPASVEEPGQARRWRTGSGAAVDPSAAMPAGSGTATALGVDALG